MTSRFSQAPDAVVMIRPHRFHPNPETASDNAFQRTDGKLSTKEIAKAAYNELTALAARIEEEGVTVHIFEDRPMVLDHIARVACTARSNYMFQPLS